MDLTLWLMAVLLIAFYNARVHMRVCLDTEDTPAFTLRVVAPCFARTLPPPKSGAPKRPGRDVILSALRPLRHLAASARVREVHIAVCTRDAAKAALLYGAACALRGVVECRQSSGERLQAECIISLRAGQIMEAALWFGARYVRRRLHTWKKSPAKSIPLKTS